MTTWPLPTNLTPTWPDLPRPAPRQLIHETASNAPTTQFSYALTTAALVNPSRLDRYTAFYLTPSLSPPPNETTRIKNEYNTTLSFTLSHDSLTLFATATFALSSLVP